MLHAARQLPAWLIFDVRQKMTPEQPVPPHVAKAARSFRLAGWLLLILGSIALIHPLVVLFDPDAVMPLNGVPRKEFLVKLAVASFVATFPLIGAVMALSPRRKLEAKLAAFDRFAHSFAMEHLNRK